MEYSIDKSGNRVILNVLANADESMIGLHINNSKILSINYSDLLSLVLATLGERERNYFDLSLIKYHAFPVSQKSGEADNPIIVMETIGSIDFEGILDALKFYKTVNIFSCYLLSYRYVDEKIYCGGIGKVFLYEHAIQWPDKPYCMTEEDKVHFKQWFKENAEMMYGEHNDKFTKMKSLYLNSYWIGNVEQSFVMLSVILEMLIGATQEMTYRISRNVGAFLSTNSVEMSAIIKRIKRLYNVRSKYVHEGKSIVNDDLYDLREIVRKIIVLMFEKGMHKPGFDFKQFSDEISLAGY